MIVCLSIVHAYPPSMSRTKWLPARIVRPYVAHVGQADNYLHSVDGQDQDLNDNNGFATWLFRSRKFCCAPPL